MYIPTCQHTIHIIYSNERKDTNIMCIMEESFNLWKVVADKSEDNLSKIISTRLTQKVNTLANSISVSQRKKITWKSNVFIGQVGKYRSVKPAFGKLSQEDQASLGDKREGKVKREREKVWREKILCSTGNWTQGLVNELSILLLRYIFIS